MTIPDYETLMRPFLQQVSDGNEHIIKDVRERLARDFALTEEEMAELLPSGRTPTFSSRVHWAKTYLYKAGALDSPRRGAVVITDRGRSLLKDGPPRITAKYLYRFPEFADWQTTDTKKSTRDAEETKASPMAVDGQSPEESIEESYRQIRKSVEDELLGEIQRMDPTAFEQLVVDFLLRLGYGGATGEGVRIGKSGDEGIDGVISEDALGLERVYIQAKRWQQNVGRPEVMAFAGSLIGQQASKGVFITASEFTQSAQDYVDRIEKRIVLIGGRTLVRMMYDKGLGVAVQRAYEIKRVDSDYFQPDV